AQLAGAAAEALVHAVIDDGRILRRFAHTTGKGAFHDLAGHGVNGRALLDPAAHHQVQLPAGIAVTTIVVALLRRRAGRWPRRGCPWVTPCASPTAARCCDAR